MFWKNYDYRGILALVLFEMSDEYDFSSFYLQR
jgi:hypothetical protein